MQPCRIGDYTLFRRNGKLEPAGPDRLSKSGQSVEKIGNDWWQIGRSWTWPHDTASPHAAEPLLVGEQRTRLTGLGVAHPEYGVLVSESETLILGEADALAKDPQKTENRKLKTSTYRQRQSGTVTSVTDSPTGARSIQITIGGLTRESIQIANIADPGSRIAYRTTHDALGRPVAVSDPRTGGESRTEYDPATGRVLAQIDTAGQRTEFAYYPAEHPSA